MSNYWAFLARPDVYRITDVIQEREIDTWRVGRHAVRTGDRALIWKAKGGEDHRGIVALAEVLSDPALRSSPNSEYYADSNNGTTPMVRSEIRYFVPEALPIWYDEGPTSLLGQLSCARATGGTVFRVTVEQWSAIMGLVGGWPGEHAKGRSPHWVRDELILVLDFYFSRNGSLPPEDDSDLVELSETLRSLPIHLNRHGSKGFRSPSSIYLKLNHLAGLKMKPDYTGPGYAGGGGNQDQAVINEFADNREQLHQFALAIRSGAAELSRADRGLPDDDEEYGITETSEGRVLFKLHKFRERDPSLVRAKKAKAIKLHGILVCEVCSFVFSQCYGELGDGFIECHHTRPISKMKPGEKTRLEDLALVCANCHRMLHRGGETLSIAELQAVIAAVAAYKPAHNAAT